VTARLIRHVVLFIVFKQMLPKMLPLGELTISKRKKKDDYAQEKETLEKFI